MNPEIEDDPILTAYALGELEPGERAAVEARLQADPAARQFVAETRAFALQLTGSLQMAPASDLTPAQKAAILAQAQVGQPLARGKVIPFLRWVVPISAAAAITAACVVALQGTATPISSPPVAQNAATPAQAPASESPATTAPAFAAAPPQAVALTEKVINQPIFKVQDQSLAANGAGKKFEGFIQYGSPIDTARVDDLAVAAKPLAFQKPMKAPAERTPEGPASATASVAESKTDSGGQAPLTGPRHTAGKVREFASRAAGGVAGGYSAEAALLAPKKQGLAAYARSAEALSDSSTRKLGEEPGAPGAPGLPQTAEGNTEAYDRISDHEFLAVRQNPLSTFSIDVDTASYTLVRRFLEGGNLPPQDAVRIEELLNYFDYDYPQPTGEQPFSVNVEVAPAPWNTKHLLAKIGLKGRTIAPEKRPPTNLVFLLDVSGSMDEPNKLPLVRKSMKMLVERLNPEDRVAIIVYAGASGMALPSTPASKRKEIHRAIDELRAGGSTNGAAGIQLAYDVAKANFIADGANRVVLCTDGDFNVGITNQGALLRMIESKAKSKVFLTVLGFGMGNYKDSTLEKLADKGNGNYGYIDDAREAKKMLVDGLSGTLVTIAKDVKVQVEFNPAQVGSYRLIGYENRLLKAEDFNDDQKDAGEIGAGHTVTALYELTPAGETQGTPRVDPLKYQQPSAAPKLPDESTPAPTSSELMTVKLRYKEPTGDVSQKIEQVVPASAATPASLAGLSKDFQFAAAVAEFGMLLRDSPFKGEATWKSAADLAENGLGADAKGERHELLKLIEQAKRLAAPEAAPQPREGERVR